ncbi:hypothetical protein [Pseudolysinimonas sp.]
MPSSPDSRAAWSEILDEFEEQLARVDILTSELADAGIVLPLSDLAQLGVDLGPIPESMRARALSVLEAQREAMGRLERLRTDLSQHLTVTRAASQRPDVAVYLDRTA